MCPGVFSSAHTLGHDRLCLPLLFLQDALEVSCPGGGKKRQFFSGPAQECWLGSLLLKRAIRGTSGGTAGGSLPANAGDAGSVPGQGRFHVPRAARAGAPQLLKPVCLEPAPCSRRHRCMRSRWAETGGSLPLTATRESSHTAETRRDKNLITLERSSAHPQTRGLPASRTACTPWPASGPLWPLWRHQLQRAAGGTRASSRPVRQLPFGASRCFSLRVCSRVFLRGFCLTPSPRDSALKGARS